MPTAMLLAWYPDSGTCHRQVSSPLHTPGASSGIPAGSAEQVREERSEEGALLADITTLFRWRVGVVSQMGACLHRNVGVLPGHAAVCRGARLAHLPGAAVHRQR